MTIRAYPETYLAKVQRLLGDAFVYAIEDCGISGEEFIRFFLMSSAPRRIEQGDIPFILGQSGIELAQKVLEETGLELTLPYPAVHLTRSAHYWIGWVCAYYQWNSDRTFSELFHSITYSELLQLYPALHEAAPEKFADIISERIREQSPETHLKYFRTLNRLSQSQLAERTGVGIRSIQLYEQRQKDINKASAEVLYRLSKALGCSMEALLEAREN
ncbi:MAG: helix-turn-helix transcriptional regulator [Lachnospiraceae bacterium]|nr:helix-turn-helix transcriptional regulator [Lachnospiraceae bacterium]